MRLILVFLLIRLIIPQTSINNAVIREIDNTGFFANYAETKSVVLILTWTFLFRFLFLHIALR